LIKSKPPPVNPSDSQTGEPTRRLRSKRRVGYALNPKRIQSQR
jgi:hypothetical protein